MRYRDIKVGETYHIDFRDKSFPIDTHYVGPARLNVKNPIGYPTNTLRFVLPSGEDGFFSAADVKTHIKAKRKTSTNPRKKSNWPKCPFCGNPR